MRGSFTATSVTVAFLTLGCPEQTPQTIELEKYRVDVRLVGDRGLDLGGVVVRFNDQDQRRTRPDGALRVGYLGARESTLDIAIVLPSDLQSPQPTVRRFTLKHDAAGLPAPIRFELPVEQKAKGGAPYVVVIETECEGQAVRIDGVDVGTTNREGYLSRRLFRHAGQKLTVAVEERGRCGGIACDIPLTSSNTIINIEGRCPDKRARSAADGVAANRRPSALRSSPDGPPARGAVARNASRRTRDETKDEPRRKATRSDTKKTWRKVRQPRREERRERDETPKRTIAANADDQDTDSDGFDVLPMAAEKRPPPRGRHALRR